MMAGSLNWKIEGKKKVTRQEKRRLWKEFETVRIHGTERSVERRQRANIAGQMCCIAKGRRRH